MIKLCIKNFYRSLENIYGSPRKHKVQLTYYLLAKIVEKIDFECLKDIRDWILMILTHVGSFRGGEICPARWSDVAADSYINKFTGVKTNIFIVFMDSTKNAKQQDGAVVTISCPSEISSFNILPLLLQYIKLLDNSGFMNDYMFPSLRPNHKGLNKHIAVSTLCKSINDYINLLVVIPII